MQRAKRWFATERKTWANMEERNPAHAEYRVLSMEWLKPEGKVCLDAGCGWGRFLRDYVAHKAKFVIGIDLNPFNLDKCKREVSGADLVRGDIESLPFKEGAFEVESCVGTMEHIPRPDIATMELGRVLQKNGLIFSTWNHYEWLRILQDGNVRRRFAAVMRDLVPFLRKQRVHRNTGFSLEEVRTVIGEAGLELVQTGFWGTHSSYFLTLARRSAQRGIEAPL